MNIATGEIAPILNKSLQQDFRVGNWEVRPSANEIYLAGSKTAARTLEPRLMRLLCLMAANPGQVLTREQLTCELWPNVIVNENSLTRAISELRKQLSQSSNDTTTYVQTISKRGYRLAPETSLVLQPEFSDGTMESLHWIPKAQTSYLAGVIAGLALLLGVGVYYSPSQSPDSSPQLNNQALIYDRVIQADSTAVMPGSMAVLSSTSIGTDGWSNGAPVISNDGNSVAHIRYSNTGSTIYLSKIASTQAAMAIYSSNEYLYNLKWSPVGNALLFASQKTLATNTLHSDSKNAPSLIMLDLNRFAVQVLLEGDDREATDSSDTVLKLT